MPIKAGRGDKNGSTPSIHSQLTLPLANTPRTYLTFLIKWKDRLSLKNWTTPSVSHKPVLTSLSIEHPPLNP